LSRKKDRAIAYGAKMHEEGADLALCCIARQFAVKSRDIRMSDKTVAEKAEALADRIRGNKTTSNDPMTDQELLQALKRTGRPDNLRCFGCGYEHSCGIHGCWVNRAAADRIRELLAERNALAREIGRASEKEATTK